jgi:hypothetical protein
MDLVMSSSSNGGSKSGMIADSPMSPPPLKKVKLDESNGKEKSGPVKMNLLELWRKKTDKPDLRVLPQTIKLYPNLRVEEKGEKSGKDKGDRGRDPRQEKNAA